MQDEKTPASVARVRVEDAGQDASAVAGRALAEWRRVDAVLSPVIGHGGVAALYRRSLFLLRPQHPWLPGNRAGALDAVEFTELQAALALRPAADARAANSALQRTFHDLLDSLIGTSLTERLLQPASDPASNGDVPQDSSS